MWPTNNRALAMEPAQPVESRGLESMEKSSDAYRTISEAAEELDLPQHVLRFWETRFPQVRPLKRGGGRRFYRPDDLVLLRAIRHLLYGEGYTIRGVQKMLKEQGPRQVVAQALGSGALGSGALGSGALGSGALEGRADVARADSREAGDEAPDFGAGEPDAPEAGASPDHGSRAPAPQMRPMPQPASPQPASAQPAPRHWQEPPALTLPLFHLEEEPEAREPAPPLSAPPPQRPAADPRARPVHAPGAGLSEEGLRMLEGALAELEECRRLLHSAAA